MQIVMLDLMPILWGICAVIALLFLISGKWGLPVRIVPAACAAVCLYFLGYPPRLQAAVFLTVYALFGVSRFLAVRIGKRQKNKPSSPVMHS